MKSVKGFVLLMLFVVGLALCGAPEAYALVFSADGQSVQVPDAPSLAISGPLTVEARVRPERGIEAHSLSFIVSKNANGTGFALLVIGGRGGNMLQFEGGKGEGVNCPFGVKTGQWAHVAGVWDSAEFRLYIDGNLKATYPGRDAPIENHFPLYIGSSPFGPETNWRGAIGEVRIWARARTQDEIRATMTTHLKGNEPQLRACWNLDALQGLAVTDATGKTPPGRLDESLEASLVIEEYSKVGLRDPKWDGLVCEGLDHLFKKDYLNARMSFEKAYVLGCRDFELLYRLGDSCMKTGARVQGEKYLSMAAEMYPQTRGVRADADQPDILLGDYYSGFVNDQFTRGEKDLQRALEHYQRVNAQARIESVQRWIAPYRIARESIAVFDRNPTADEAFQIAQQYRGLKAYSDEAHWLDKALEMEAGHVEALIERIKCAVSMLDWDKGESLIERTVAAAKASGDMRRLSRAHNAATEVLLNHGYSNPVKEVLDPREGPAQQHALAAVEAAEQSHDERTIYNARWCLAQSYWSWSGQYRNDLSVVELEKALAIAEKHGWTGEIERCKSYLAARRYDVEFYKSGFKMSTSEEASQRTDSNYQAYYDGAQKWIEQYETELNRQSGERSRRAASNFEAFKLSYGPMIAACLHLGRYEEAFFTSERARAASFLDLLGGRMTQTREQLNDRRRTQAQALQTQVTQLKDQVALLQKTSQGDGLRSTQRDLAVQSQALQTLQTKIGLADREITSLSKVDPLTLPQIQELLGDATLIVYSGYTEGRSWLAESSFVAIVTRDSFHVIRDVNFQYERVRNLCRHFREAGDHSAAKAQADPDWDKACRDLYKEFFEPVRQYVKTKQVIIVPYGGMNLIPFACLKGENGHYLAEDYDISYTPSGSVLKFCQAKRKPAMKNALILANPQLPEAGSALKFAEGEAEAVGKLFPQSVLLRGVEATKSAFVKLAPEYDVLHLACHSVMDQKEPMLSNLRLARDNENNGVLTVREIFDLNLDANLVTLSACNTGAGEVTGSGFEFMGMTRAFLYAGTPSVLASLWSVDDRATAELMELFYKNLLSGQTKSEALQQAQLAMMKKYENPYYWGAFVLYGDYR